MAFHYKRSARYTHDETRNESRANVAEKILSAHSDRNAEDEDSPTQGAFLDVTDVLADFIHFCARAGLEWDEVVDKAARSHAGDLEDGPEAKRDTERFPEGVSA